MASKTIEVTVRFVDIDFDTWGPWPVDVETDGTKLFEALAGDLNEVYMQHGDQPIQYVGHKVLTDEEDAEVERREPVDKSVASEEQQIAELLAALGIGGGEGSRPAQDPFISLDDSKLN